MRTNLKRNCCGRTLLGARKRKINMKTKTGWLHFILLGGVLVAAGCGAAPSAPAPAPAALAMYSSSANFGDVAIGNSVALGVTFANTGGLPLTLTQNSVSGAGFATSGIGAGLTLGPGQYATLVVGFNPSAAGSATGSISLTSTTSQVPITVPLTGNGIVSTHLVTFDWAPSNSPVIGYNVYLRSSTGDSWTRMNSTPLNTNAYTDWDVQSGQSYMFAVTSVGTTNVESAFSNATAATVPSS